MRILLTFAALAIAFTLSSQTTLYTETFESGGAGFDLNTTDAGSTTGTTNSWYLNNAYPGGTFTPSCFPFSVTIPAVMNQPAAVTNSPQSTYLHVSNDDAVSSGVECGSYLAYDGILCEFGGSIFAGMNTDIDCSGYENITIDFHWLSRGASSQYGELMYSTNGGSSWLAYPDIYNLSTVWNAESVTLAAWDNVSTLRFGFRFVNNAGGVAPADPGMCVDEIIVTGTGLAPSLETGAVPTGPFCPEDMIDVPYTAIGAFGGSNIFTVQLSDETGDFATPENIGSAAGGAGSGVISCTLPALVTPGTMYRIRVVSSDPVIAGNDNGDDITLESCAATGCTDPLAYNYDPSAVEDDGCCFYLDTNLICGPGTVWNATLGYCEVVCQADLDFNGNIGTADLLMFLAVFGTSCP